MRAPSFRCTEEPDGSLILHYYSERAGLEHIVIGIVKVNPRMKPYEQTEALILKQMAPSFLYFLLRAGGGIKTTWRRGGN